MMSFGRCFMDQNFLRKLIVLSGTIGISFSAVFSAILAAAFFREIPTLQAVCGSIVIIFGIWWYLKSSDD